MCVLTETKINHQGKVCSLDKLKQYCGMRCEISINAHTHDNKVMATYTYEEFDFDNGKFVLCLFDAKNESMNTRISKELIICINHISEDKYEDVVHIYTNDFILSVTTLEDKPTSLICDYCKEEIDRYKDYYSDEIFFGYGSKFDGILKHIDLHWKCVDNVFSNIVKEDSTND